MSNSTSSSPESGQVSHNTYFEGKVQSLGLETLAGKATVGVMKKGSYTFSASSPEKMIVISGTMEVRVAGAEVKIYTEREAFDAPAGSSFEAVCDADVAYLCYYGS